MTTKSVHSRLGRFASVSTKRGIAFYSRFNDNRYVEVIDQNGQAVTLPIIIEADRTERGAYHPNTIKGLIEFLEGK
jgi:hypothetical protein